MDEDAGMNSILDYHLLNNTGHAFSLTPGLSPSFSPALLSVARPLDYETLSQYHLTLVARDRGNPALSSIVTIEVRLQDVSDSPPVFNRTAYMPTVEEGVAGGSPILQLQPLVQTPCPRAGLSMTSSRETATSLK